MIVVVTNRKGGVGKSTLATHAAVRLAMTGRPTVLIDADMQATSSRWAETRARNALEPRVDARTEALADPVIRTDQDDDRRRRRTGVFERTFEAPVASPEAVLEGDLDVDADAELDAGLDEFGRCFRPETPGDQNPVESSVL
jgi:hypothetical protein